MGTVILLLGLRRSELLTEPGPGYSKDATRSLDSWPSARLVLLSDDACYQPHLGNLGASVLIHRGSPLLISRGLLTVLVLTRGCTWEVPAPRPPLDQLNHDPGAWDPSLGFFKSLQVVPKCSQG